MASATIPAKRQRIDSENSNEEVPVRRSKGIWFDDGNLILQAENTQFRVHQSVLARHGAVFRDMFTVPQGTQAEMVDGCPLVRMAGDTWKEWKYVLSLLYRITTPEPKWPDISQLTAMVRLCKKYELDELYREAKRLFEAQFPRSLEDLTALRRNVQFLHWLVHDISGIFWIVDECEMQSVLPIVYYIALISPYGNIFVAENNISTAHLLALINGRIELCKHIFILPYSWTSTKSSDVPTQTCNSPANCRLIRAEMQQHVSRLSLEHVSLALDDWHDYLPMKMKSSSLCSKCRMAAQEVIDSGRRAIWDTLPYYFLGEEWRDLEGMQESCWVTDM